jgi:hypothetical protein
MFMNSCSHNVSPSCSLNVPGSTCYLHAMDTRRFARVSFLVAATVLTGGLMLTGCSSAARSSPPTSRAGAFPSTSTTVAMAQGSWSGGTQVSSVAADSLEGISCASPAFCVAVDALGDAYTYTGGTWSSGTQIESQYELISVSCPSSSFCVAVDKSGNAYTDAGGTWSSPQPVTGAGGSLESVSCPSSSFCVAGGNLSSGAAVAYTYTGGTWSSGKQFGSAGGLASVSCPSSSFCAAVGVTTNSNSVNGYVYTYTDGAWSSGKRLSSSGGPISVSCPSSSFCAAVGATLISTPGGGTGNGFASTYTDGTWSSGEQVGSTNNLLAVSCPSSSFCIAAASNVTATPADDSAYSFTYSDGAWSSGKQIGPPIAAIAAVSCPSSTFCVAVGAAGTAGTAGTATATAFTYSGGS